MLLLAWVYPSLYLAQNVKGNPLVPSEYKSAVQVLSVFAGPVVFLALMVMDKKEFDKHVNPWSDLMERAQDALMNVWQGREGIDNRGRFDPAAVRLRRHGVERDLRAWRRAFRQEVFDLTARIIENALQQRASDILIDPLDRTKYAIRLRIDGALRTVQELPIETCKAVINSVKAVSNMDIAERRRPQDGAFTAGRNGSSVSFRVASAGALNGEKLSIRVSIGTLASSRWPTWASLKPNAMRSGRPSRSRPAWC